MPKLGEQQRCSRFGSGDVDALLPAETCKRLAQVKRNWDPDDLILANHAVALATR